MTPIGCALVGTFGPGDLDNPTSTLGALVGEVLDQSGVLLVVGVGQRENPDQSGEMGRNF